MKKIIGTILAIIIIISCFTPISANAQEVTIDDICYIEPHNRVTIVSNADTPHWSYNVYKNKKWKVFRRNSNFEYEQVTSTKYPKLSDNVSIKSVKVSTMNNGHKKVIFAFKDLPKDAKYKVTVADTVNFKRDKILSKTFKKNTKSFTFKDIEVGKSYYVKIKVIKKDGYFTTKTKLFVIEG